MADPKPETATVEYSLFEGLFARALELTPAMRADLRAVGFDPDKPQATYPGVVWIKSLEVALRHVFPQLPREEGLRQLGWKVIDGFLDTIAGRVVGVALPFLGMEGIIKRLPRYWDMVRKAQGAEMRTEQVAERDWRVVSNSRAELPDYSAGLIQRVLSRLKDGVRVDVESRTNGYALRIRWEESARR